MYLPNYNMQNRNVATCNYKAIVSIHCNHYMLHLWPLLLENVTEKLVQEKLYMNTSELITPYCTLQISAVF